MSKTLRDQLATFIEAFALELDTDELEPHLYTGWTHAHLTSALMALAQLDDGARGWVEALSPRTLAALLGDAVVSGDLSSLRETVRALNHRAEELRDDGGLFIAASPFDHRTAVDFLSQLESPDSDAEDDDVGESDFEDDDTGESDFEEEDTGESDLEEEDYDHFFDDHYEDDRRQRKARIILDEEDGAGQDPKESRPYLVEALQHYLDRGPSEKKDVVERLLAEFTGNHVGASIAVESGADDLCLQLARSTSSELLSLSTSYFDEHMGGRGHAVTVLRQGDQLTLLNPSGLVVQYRIQFKKGTFEAEHLAQLIKQGLKGGPLMTAIKAKHLVPVECTFKMQRQKSMTCHYVSQREELAFRFHQLGEDALFTKVMELYVAHIRSERD